MTSLNCSMYSGKMREAELFGIEKGTATGVDRKVGKIQLADSGTLFLDELGELTLSMQAKLLRVLEDKEVSMLGGSTAKKVDFRLIAATNRDLNEMIEQGTFRQDLYYRINTIKIHLTPLRERPEDIEPLVNHFLETFAPGRKFQFTRSAWRLISEYSWPGNVRELRNEMERISILHSGGPIRENVLSSDIRDAVKTPQAVALRDHTDHTEKALIARILTECGWNQAESARRLGLPYSTLQRKIKKFKIKAGKDDHLSHVDEKKLIVQTLMNSQWNLTKTASQLRWKLSTLKTKIKFYKIRKRS